MSPPPQPNSPLIEQLSEGAVLLSYNRPKQANAFTAQQYDDLREALVWARNEPNVRVVVVAGKGKHFCAGRDMGGSSDMSAELAAGEKLFNKLFHYPKVLIAAVHGASVGWGCTQLACFDLVYAHQDAYFETPFMKLGLVPEVGSSYTFPKLMGRMRANGLLLAGDRLSAQEAYMGGLVTAVVQAPTADEFLAKVVEKAKKMGRYSAEALQMAKKLVNDAADDERLWVAAGEREMRDFVTRASRLETQTILQAFGKEKRAKL